MMMVKVAQALHIKGRQRYDQVNDDDDEGCSDGSGNTGCS